MFQHVVRWTFLITIWKKYKGQLLTTLAYLLGLMLVSFVHQDYLDFVLASNDGQDFIATSFVIKWVAYFVITTAYYFVFKSFSKNEVDTNPKGHGNLSFLKKFGNKSSSRSESNTYGRSSNGSADESHKTSDRNKDNSKESFHDDPFANIRKKNKLKSESDYLLEKQNRTK